MNESSIYYIVVVIVLVLIISVITAAVIKKGDSVYRNAPHEQNVFEGKKVRFVADDNDPVNADGIRGHLESDGLSSVRNDIYAKYIKRVIDTVVSLLGLIILSPVFLVICAAIKIDDPGPVFFEQKRLGRNKMYFKLHKFRSMKMSTPHDIPTHMLDDPDQYITRVGKVLRKSSLDELPQIWDIFIGNMSIIGPRPGLWNQDLLTAERDLYDVNALAPGLTGLAQIRGRDELEIPEKARLDGEYAEKISFITDLKIFLGTFISVIKRDGVVEGGTGEMKKKGGSLK